MGDMKTPDFDDLLAAFDIPDLVDPKTAIESGHQDEHDGHLKQANSEVVSEDSLSSSNVHDVGVSVIVKNMLNLDAAKHGLIGTEKDGNCNSHSHAHSVRNGSHNGYLPAGPSGAHHTRNEWKTFRERESEDNTQSSNFNQFSPISSAEEFDDDEKIEVDDPVEKKVVQTFVRSSAETEDHKSFTVDDASKRRNNKDELEENGNNSVERRLSLSSLPGHENNEHESQIKERTNATKPSRLNNVTSISQGQVKPSTCTAPIAALGSKKVYVEDLDALDSVTPNRDLAQARENSKSPEKLWEQESKQPDSPFSVSSESSPASNTSTTPVIPKVRIKTFKTSSGQIKRTVTRVLPEFKLEEMPKQDDSCVISTTGAIFSSPTKPSLPATVVTTSGASTVEMTRQMTIKPVATAFLPVSAVKTAVSQIINIKLANNTTVKAKVIPAASVQSTSSTILKTSNSTQQKTVMVPASSLANTKLVPKTVHLGNLNLLPQTAHSFSCDLQQTISSFKPPHQQVKKLPSPTSQASIKVSRVQLLGSSQSSVVDAFNKILSVVNPVPVYVPNLTPPTSACISLPSGGYKCLECGDSFAFEKSLLQHYERRSVLIEVTCNHCAKSLVFYNKCSLLSHARDHKDTGVVMQCSNLTLKPVPVDLMFSSLKSPPSVPCTTPASQGPAGQKREKIPSARDQTAVISALCNAPFVAAMPLEDDVPEVCQHKLKCFECNEKFRDEKSLVMHYQQVSESSGQKTCTICRMLLSNHCSFLSHQRIHQHKSPYICPECGAICRSVHFQTHVTKNCLHYTRRVGYRCVHCSMIFADVVALKFHIQSTHCEIFYKCPLCPMAFKSAPGTHSHALTQHPGAKAGEPKVIYKCSMCDTVFTLQPLLSAHFDQHVVNHKVSVFKCPDCSMYYAQKHLMFEHIKGVHGTLKTIDGPPNLGVNLPLSTKPTNSYTTNSPLPDEIGNVQDKKEKKPSPTTLKKNVNFKSHPSSGYTCGDCNCTFSSREHFVTHMRVEHDKLLKKHPCRQCEKSFSSSHSLCRHNRLKHKGIKNVYTCPHCSAASQPFAKKVLLNQHIRLMHKANSSEAKINNVETSSDKQTSESSKRKSEEDEGSPIVNSRGFGSQPLKRLKVNILRVHKCAVCGFTTEDIAAFHKHIPQHKSDRSSFQCQECGLCYTSHSSLARHLFIVHRLKEPQGLGRYNGWDRVDEESQRENQLHFPDENDNGTPNTKCKVCGKVFDTEGNLKTHMRTHGMAFIKSKKKSVTEK